MAMPQYEGRQKEQWNTASVSTALCSSKCLGLCQENSENFSSLDNKELESFEDRLVRKGISVSLMNDLIQIWVQMGQIDISLNHTRCDKFCLFSDPSVSLNNLQRNISGFPPHLQRHLILSFSKYKYPSGSLF